MNTITKTELKKHPLYDFGYLLTNHTDGTTMLSFRRRADFHDYSLLKFRTICAGTVADILQYARVKELSFNEALEIHNLNRSFSQIQKTDRQELFKYHVIVKNSNLPEGLQNV